MKWSSLAITALLSAIAVTVASAEPPQSPDEVVRRCLEFLHLGEMASAQKCFAPGTLAEDADVVLGQAHDALQVGDSPDVELVNRAFLHTIAGDRTATLVYHIRGDTEALLVVAQTHATDAGLAITGFRWEPVPLDLFDRYPFTLAGIPFLYYAVLAAAIGVPLFILYSAVVCFRQKPRRRWLWILCILFGVGRLSVVWVPGPLNIDYLQVSPVSVQLLGAGIKKAPLYEPWRLSVSFPLGAVIFLRRRQSRSSEPEPVLAVSLQV